MVPWPFSSACFAPSLRKCPGKGGRIQLLLVHSTACLSLSVEMRLGVEEANALPSGSLFNVTPPLRIPCQRSLTSSQGEGTWRERSHGFCQRHKAACETIGTNEPPLLQRLLLMCMKSPGGRAYPSDACCSLICLVCSFAYSLNPKESKTLNLTFLSLSLSLSR